MGVYSLISSLRQNLLFWYVVSDLLSGRFLSATHYFPCAGGVIVSLSTVLASRLSSRADRRAYHASYERKSKFTR